MQRVMRLLMIIAVFWCGVHAAVPASAMTDGRPAELSAHSDHGFEPSQEGPGDPTKSDHVGHHHCPIAPDQPVASADDKPPLLAAPVFALPIEVLHSRSQAPALEPPAA